jgi:hypothetical protein
LARAAEGGDATRYAREPRVEDDTLTDFQVGDGVAHLGHLGHDLMAEHRGDREIRVEGAVAEIVAEIAEDLLCVGSTDARESRLGHHPAVPRGVRLLALFEAHRDLGQSDQQMILVVRWCPWIW